MTQTVTLRAHRYPGQLVVVEGTDGAGKSTLLRGLRNQLARERDVLSTLQPSPSARATDVFRSLSGWGQASKDFNRSLWLVTVGDRIHHSLTVIEPALRRGATVLCDRYLFTTLAHISARGETIEPWFREVASHILKPDVALLVTCPVEQAVHRIRQRPEEATRSIDVLYMGRVHAAFVSLAREGHLQPIDSHKLDPSGVVGAARAYVTAAER